VVYFRVLEVSSSIFVSLFTVTIYGVNNKIIIKKLKSGLKKKFRYMQKL